MSPTNRNGWTRKLEIRLAAEPQSDLSLGFHSPIYAPFRCTRSFLSRLVAVSDGDAAVLVVVVVVVVASLPRSSRFSSASASPTSLALLHIHKRSPYPLTLIVYGIEYTVRT